MRMNERGLTTIEVLVATASLALLIYSYLYVRGLQTELITRVNFAQNLSEVMIANVNEIKSKDRKNLPMPGDCLVRNYSLNGEFISERKIFITDSACGGQSVSSSMIEVFWKITGASAISATFEPSDFLKLPTVTPSILQIQIAGRVLSPPPGPKEQNLEAVIFHK